MVIQIIFFVLSLVLILGGAKYLTDGASALAKKFGMSPIVVGLTVVAFGTSAPELIVSLTSSIKGIGDISIGNVVGSNIFNVFAILGATAIVKPVKVVHNTIYKETPFLIIISVLFMLLSFDKLFSGVAVSGNFIDRTDSIILLLLFSMFIVYNIQMAIKDRRYKLSSDSDYKEKSTSNSPKSLWVSIIMIVGGISALVYGGDMFVDTAAYIAHGLGVSDAIIGVTLVAAGTSVPELATSVVAAYKGEEDIAVGNIIGSCVFNILFVVGISGVFHPIAVNGIGLFDYGAMLISCIVMLLFEIFFGHKIITRIEGVILFLLFISYYVIALN